MFSRTVDHLLLLLTLHVAGTLSDSGLKGPPHISGSVTSKQTFRLGETVKLDCPIRGTPTPIVEWYKDGDSVTAGWERFKSTSHGLRIKEVILDDSGEYTCKGVNGFGSEQVTFEIVIVDPNAKVTDPPPSDTIFGPEDTETDLVTWRKIVRPGSGLAPLLVETSQMPAGRIWQLPVDSTLRLKCLAQGEPEPHLIWLKDGKEIGEDRRVGRWELQVSRLNVDDSGTYSCRAVNPYGSINASFAVQVLDRTVRKPDFVGLYPQNVTIMEGSTARLQCRVISDTPLFLQWLKRLDRLSPYEAHRQAVAGVDNGRPDSDGVLQFEGWRYRVLRSGHPAFQADDGSYLDKLALDNVHVAHSGVYICIATNEAGYQYREASVNVISGSGRPLGDVSSLPGMGVGSGSDPASSGGMPTVVVIALVVGAGVVLVLMCGITYYFKSERRMRARKEGVIGGVATHHQRHPHHQREIKDLSLTAPCLPRGGDHPPPPTQPPQPPDSAPMHHRFQPQPPSCMPYSVVQTPFMGTIQLQQQEMMRLHHGINSGSGRQSGMRSCHSPLVGTATSSSGTAGSSSGGPLFLGGGGGGNWSHVYRPPPCGRSGDHSNSYPYHHEAATLMMGPPPPPSESEHAYASVHGLSNYEDLRPAAVPSSSLIRHPHDLRNNRFQRIEMV
ncbi:fibroblast growth factor receptor-like 1 isoform X1 [Daphnia pulicaria]|uniref:fibroblast growth factor receptor-like 1 isoform X1 n=1 Tax=Daphnia pulicaria TaxID=35523 RepID=UPI001EEBB4F2|nr:fibroblast growth factor receptor-like 1 isoform X1 [Daphnia pulicaria]